MWCDVIVLLMTSLVGLVTSFDKWTIDKDCRIPGNPSRHPVILNRPTWLRLQEMEAISPAFWLSFYGSSLHSRRLCSLRAGKVYRVQRANATTFNYDLEEPLSGPVPCSGKFFVLEEGSYGFVSCAEKRGTASDRALAWWKSIPFPYVAIIASSVGAAVGVAAVVVAVSCWVVKRRRARGGVAFNKD